MKITDLLMNGPAKIVIYIMVLSLITHVAHFTGLPCTERERNKLIQGTLKEKVNVLLNLTLTFVFLNQALSFFIIYLYKSKYTRSVIVL